MNLNSVCYQVMKPTPIVRADGAQDYSVVAICLTMSEAATYVMTHKINGARVVCCVCVHVQDGPPPKLRDVTPNALQS